MLALSAVWFAAAIACASAQRTTQLPSPARWAGKLSYVIYIPICACFPFNPSSPVS